MSYGINYIQKKKVKFKHNNSYFFVPSVAKWLAVDTVQVKLNFLDVPGLKTQNWV